MLLTDLTSASIDNLTAFVIITDCFNGSHQGSVNCIKHTKKIVFLNADVHLERGPCYSHSYCIR